MDKYILRGIAESPDGVKREVSIKSFERDSEVDSEIGYQIELDFACYAHGWKLIEYLGKEYVSP